ncbi:unnamed protein product [Fusarium graminearum]|nr:unnamed protein product [Fusarium graminearum]
MSAYVYIEKDNVVYKSTQLYQYNHVPETKANLDWADLPTIDLSLYGTESGNAELAQTLIEAIRTKGFFYVTNYGISQEEVDTQFSLGQQFYELPLEEKVKYQPDLDAGDYNGYRPAGRRVLSGGIKDKTEVWNMATNDGHITQPLPELLQKNKTLIENFSKDLHDKVLDPLLHLIAIALELPADFFTKLHQWNIHDESHLRYMKYSKFSPEEREKLSDGLWSLGHTDLGTITLLFRQPVAALQIKDHKTGEWKWAKPLDGSLTVNTCDALSFLTGGYIKSTVHRVSAPPKDQEHVDRLGLLYFARPQNDLILKTIDSPVLKRAGFTQNEFEAGNHKVPTMGEFTTLKQTWQQRKGKLVSKRKHTSTACDICRRRKTRCGGERPTCFACVRNGHSAECSYETQPTETQRQAWKRKYSAVDGENSVHRRFIDILRSHPEQDVNDILNRLRGGTSVDELVRHVESGDLLLELSVAPGIQWRHNPGGLLTIPDLPKTANNPYVKSLIYHIKFGPLTPTRPRPPPAGSLASYNAPYHTAGMISVLLDTCQLDIEATSLDSLFINHLSQLVNYDSSCVPYARPNAALA